MWGIEVNFEKLFVMFIFNNETKLKNKNRYTKTKIFKASQDISR